MPKLLWILTLLALGSLARADTPAQHEAVYDRVSLSEEASTEIENDLMVAVLYSRHQGHQPARLAEQVNREIEQAIRLAKETPEIKVRTLNYNTQPVYDKGRITAWRVSQSLRLESTRSDVLGELLGQLQENLKLQSLSYEVSPQQRRKHIDTVIETALARFQERARLVSTALGRKGWRLVRLAVNDGSAPPVPIMRAEMFADMAMSKRQPVAIESGTSRLSVSVTGEIELRD